LLVVVEYQQFVRRRRVVEYRQIVPVFRPQ
jgi:hypothetical protein